MTIAEKVKSIVSGISPANEVILFGSRARGDFKPDSDWDFLILLDLNQIDNNQKETLLAALYQLELAENQVISPILYTKTEWNKRAVAPIFKNIQKEGKAV
jgi:uncharacterized protein